MAAGTRVVSADDKRRKSIKVLDDELIASGILTLTGGRDRYGHPLVVLPTDTKDQLYTRYTSAHLVLVIRYYAALCRHGNSSPVTKTTTSLGTSSTSGAGLAFLVNLQRWKKECIQILVDALDAAQSEHQGTVRVLYAIQPKARDLQRLFKKLTGLRRSKRHPKTKNYETVVVAAESDLLRYMDIRQLTEDFGGSLRYNHQTWVKFMRTVDDLEESINKTLDKLPEAHDKLSMMCEYDIPDNQSQAETLLAQIRRKYQDVMRDLNLEHIIDECKAVLRSLGDSGQGSATQYSDIVQTTSYKDAKNNLRQYERQLIRSREELKAVWQTAENRILVSARLIKYKAKAIKVLTWVREVGMPTVEGVPEIANSLSKAEMLKTQYETGFYTIAKNVLWLSEKIQKKLDDAVARSKDSDPDVAPFTKKFKASLEKFRSLAERKHTVYVNVHTFFLSSMKINPSETKFSSGQNLYSYILQLAKWYRRTLSFLPFQLLMTTTPGGGGGHHGSVLVRSDAWTAATSDYLSSHPAPKPRHLDRLKALLSVINNLAVRNHARLLVHRVGVLCVLLQEPSKVSSEDLQGALRWRHQIFQGHDEVTLMFTNTSTSSLIGLDELAAVAASSGENNHVGSMNFLLRQRPKLRNGAQSQILTPARDTAQRGYLSLDRRHLHHSSTPINYHHPHHNSLTDNHSMRHPSFFGESFISAEDLTDNSDLGHHGRRSQDSGRHSGGVERYVSLSYDDDYAAERRQNLLPAALRHISLEDLTADGDSSVLPRTEAQRNKSHLSNTGITDLSQRAQQRRPTDRNPGVSEVRTEVRRTPERDLEGNISRPHVLDIDTVVSSNLCPEEKLDLMAKMCEGEGIDVSPELYYKLNPERHVTGRLRARFSDDIDHGQPLLSSSLPTRLQRPARPRSSSGISPLVMDMDARPLRPRSAAQISDELGYSVRDERREAEVRRRQTRPLSMYEVQDHMSPTDSFHPSKHDSGFSEFLVRSAHDSDPSRRHHDLRTNPNQHPSSSSSKYGRPLSQGGPIYRAVPRLVVSDEAGLVGSLYDSQPELTHTAAQPRNVALRRHQNPRAHAQDRRSAQSRWSDSSENTPLMETTRRRRKPSKRSSIKVEEWMQRQEESFDAQQVSGYGPEVIGGDRKRSVSPNRLPATQRQKDEKLDLLYMEPGRDHAVAASPYSSSSVASLPRPGPSSSLLHTDSLAGSSQAPDTESLTESQQLHLLHEAELDQEIVEQSLQETEKILQEQEDLLIQDYDLPSSPSSTTSSATLLNSDRISASSLSMLPGDGVGSQKGHEVMPLGQGDEAPWEGSVSEESGVYTQTSSDSRFRLNDSRQAPPTSKARSLTRGLPLEGVLSENDDMSFNGSSVPSCPSASGSVLVTSTNGLNPHTLINGSTIGALDESDPSGRLLQVHQDSSLGDSSSQTTVATEIHRDQSLSSEGSGMEGQTKTSKSRPVSPPPQALNDTTASSFDSVDKHDKGLSSVSL